MKLLPPKPLILSLAIAALAVQGCASNPEKTSPERSFKDLYDGRSAVAYATEFPAETSEEALIRSEQARLQGDSDQALFLAVRALELDPKSEQAAYRIGLLHEQRGNPQLAARAFRWTLGLNPAHPGALERMGLLRLEARAYSDAEKLFRAALATEPGRWRAHNGLGVLADLRGEPTAAIEHYTQALARNPNSAELLNNLGYSKYLNGDWSGARDALHQALSHQPDYPLAWRNLGMVHTRLGNYSKALDAFEHAMERAEAYNNMGYLCMLDGKREMAERFLQQAIDASPAYYPAAQRNLEILHTRHRAGSGNSRETAAISHRMQEPLPRSPADNELQSSGM